jgi:hypothetical protein
MLSSPLKKSGTRVSRMDSLALGLLFVALLPACGGTEGVPFEEETAKSDNTREFNEWTFRTSSSTQYICWSGVVDSRCTANAPGNFYTKSNVYLVDGHQSLMMEVQEIHLLLPSNQALRIPSPTCIDQRGVTVAFQLKFLDHRLFDNVYKNIVVQPSKGISKGDTYISHSEICDETGQCSTFTEQGKDGEVITFNDNNDPVIDYKVIMFPVSHFWNFVEGDYTINFSLQ